MCLKRVCKKTMSNEGVAFKTFYRLPHEDKMYSFYQYDLVLTDSWMLNKNPITECRCGVKVVNDIVDIKKKHNNALVETHEFYMKNLFDVIPKNIKGCYEHGFHMYKREIDALEEKHSPGKWQKSAIKAGELEIVVKKVFYKGYIAEDPTQVVARQIYVPQITESPLEQALTYEMVEREWIKVN